MTKRQILLPPYLADIPIWEDYVAALDSVWKTAIDDPIAALLKIRQLYIVSETSEEKILNREMLASTDFDTFERAILVQQVNLLGLLFTDTELLEDEDLQRVYRNIGHFWFSKGKYNFIDFIGFCLNAILEIKNLWTTNYAQFVTEEEAGTPIWEGGPWYPTTHVALSFDADKFIGVDINTLIKFFYEFANYNLVVKYLDMQARNQVVANTGKADIVALVGYSDDDEWITYGL